MGKMSREDLFREIGEIDEAYVEEARRAGRKRRAFPKAGRILAAAASLILCVGAGYAALSLTQDGMNNTGGTSGGAMEAAQDACSMAQENDQIADGAAPEEQESQVMAQPDRLADTALEAEEDMGQQVTDLSADIEGDAGEELEYKEDLEKESEIREDGAEGAGRDEETVQGAMAESVSNEADAMILTWEAARTDANYGRYVDVQVPEGYSFTSGTRSASGLFVVWSKGMEEIDISCRQADESVSDWLVDTDIPEEYDMGLYSIPWADSVSEELIQKVNNATFRPDQITQEIVNARSYQVQEQGDASGWRTRIAILYSDNVLVEISSKGPSPEEIYGLLNLEN